MGAVSTKQNQQRIRPPMKNIAINLRLFFVLSRVLPLFTSIAHNGVDQDIEPTEYGIVGLRWRDVYDDLNECHKAQQDLSPVRLNKFTHG